MAGNTTDNSSALRRAEVYSSLILDTIKDDFLPDGIHRDVSDFQDGDTLNITTFGDVVLRDIDEDQDTPIDPLDTGRITLNISKYLGSGIYMTDKMRQDSWQAQQFDASIVPKQLRAIKERYETDLLAAGPSGQVAANPNDLNGYAHRFIASGTNNTLDMEDFIYAKLALDKANVSDMGRIAIFDPLAEASLNRLPGLITDNRMFDGIINTGFGKNMRFVRNILGFDCYISNRLPRLNNETVDTSGILVPAPSGNSTIAAGIANQFMAVGEDTESPIMGAWRQMPSFEGHRNTPRRRDEFYATARWGFGLQRKQTLVTMISSAIAYK